MDLPALGRVTSEMKSPCSELLFDRVIHALGRFRFGRSRLA